MNETFFIIQLLFWKLVLFYAIIYCVVGLISVIAQSLSGYSWYGFKNYTFIGNVLSLVNFFWLLVPLAFLIDFIHLIIKWIFF